MRTCPAGRFARDPFRQGAGLFDFQPPDGRGDPFASRADDLDPVGFVEFLPDGGFSQVGLAVHEACGRISELCWHSHYRTRILERAVPGIGCDRDGADEN